MAAHYRLKYGINDKLTKSLPALRHSHNGTSSLESRLSSTITPPGVIPLTIQEADSGSDSEHVSSPVTKPSPQIVHRTKSHEPQSSNSSVTLDVRQPATRVRNKPSPKFRHSSFIPTSGYDKLKFTDIEEDTHVNSTSGYVNASAAQNKSLSSPSLPTAKSYDYVRKSIAVVEDITGVYGTTPANHGYQNIKQPVDAHGMYIAFIYTHAYI